MAKPNIVGLGFKALETRRLLNAAPYAVLAPDSAPTSGMNSGALVRIENDGRLAPTRPAETAHAAFEHEHAPAFMPASSYCGPRPLGSFSRMDTATVTDFVKPSVLAPPVAADYVPLSVHEIELKLAQRLDASSQLDQADIVAPVVVHFSLSRETASEAVVYAEQIPPTEVAAPAAAKHAAVSTSDADSAGLKANPLAITQPPAGKSDFAAAALVRDGNPVAPQKGVINPQPIVKDDRLIPVVVENPRGAAYQGPQANAQERAGQIQRETAPLAGMRVSPLKRAELALPLDLMAAWTGADQEALPLFPMVTSVMPFDIASLETSIKDFFDQVNQAGLKLSAGHVNFLFSAGVVAVAAALAFELSRRKSSTPAQAPALELASTIPYSDYL